jgi:hypothetical protein
MLIKELYQICKEEMRSEKWKDQISYLVSDKAEVMRSCGNIVPYVFIRHISDKYSIPIGEVLSKRTFLDNLSLSIFAPAKKVIVYAQVTKEKREEKLLKLIEKTPIAIFNENYCTI